MSLRFRDNLPQMYQFRGYNLGQWHHAEGCDDYENELVKRQILMLKVLIFMEKLEQLKIHGDNHAWFVGWADYNNEKTR